MNNNEILKRLNALRIDQFIDLHRKFGRRQVSRSSKVMWRSYYNLARQLVADRCASPQVRRIARLLREITFSTYAQITQPHLTYYPYTNAHLIEWYLGSPSRFISKLNDQARTNLLRRVLDGVFCLLQDLLKFEQDSLEGRQEWQQEQFSQPAVTERIARIHQTLAICGDVYRQFGFEPDVLLPGLGDCNTLEEYATEASRLNALVFLSCFPQTRCHDEVVFLRTIHIGELCFFGLRNLTVTAIADLRRGRSYEATVAMRQAASIAKLLHSSFLVLQTMPVEHFQTFRPYTEQGSAVQSRSYQLLDISLRGIDSRKLEEFRKYPHLVDLVRFADPRFVSLKSALSTEHECGAMQQLLSSAQTFDQTLRRWRGLHLSFAYRYLGRGTQATGGTAGAPYLRQFLDEGFTSSDMSGFDDDQKVLRTGN